MADPPMTDADIPAYWQALGLPGLADIHVHFLPDQVLRKVWAFFDNAGEQYGTPWPIHYRDDEQRRLDTIRGFGVRAIPSLTYPHKPGMATWLNAWCTDFARRVPDAVHSATLFPEEGVATYVEQSLTAGARLFKVHVQVGGFSPVDPLLDTAWGLLEDTGVPIVMHAGSAPHPGTFTGPEPVGRLLELFPRLVLVIAHLVERYPNVHLDTTMAGTAFSNAFAPMTDDYVRRLGDLGDRVVLGADFPNIPYPYAEQLLALHRFDLGDEWLRAVLWDNGARLMGLPSD
jgi:hypothetical protein